MKFVCASDDMSLACCDEMVVAVEEWFFRNERYDTVYIVTQSVIIKIGLWASEYVNNSQ